MKSKTENTVVTRFPPSPTGLLHVGNVRTALFVYLFTRKRGGKFIIRMEDTDRARSKPEYEEDIFENLKWLGIEYDEKSPRQSERLPVYKEALNRLIDSGKAYLSEETEGQNKTVVRFKNPGTTITFPDLIRGEVTVDTSDLEDFIIARNMEEPVYHLAVVVDDMESGVTHVIRGEDHISNTARQILIIEALGGERPQYAHLPLILAPDRSKLSKRKHGEMVSVTYYRNAGYLPEALINFIALLGWNPGTDREIFSLSELIDAFDLSAVQKSGAVFNIEKLDWFNRAYIQKLDPELFRKYVEKFWPAELASYKEQKPDIFGKVIGVLREKISKFSDISTLEKEGELGYYFNTPTYEASLLNWKETAPETTARHLEFTVEALDRIPEDAFTLDSIKQAVWEYASEAGRGEVLWPLRFALTGKKKSPDPFVVSEIIGKKETLVRIRKGIELLKA